MEGRWQSKAAPFFLSNALPPPYTLPPAHPHYTGPKRKPGWYIYTRGRSAYLHGEVRDLIEPLHVLVVGRVPEGGVPQEQPAQHVSVPPREHLRKLKRGSP